MRNKEFREVQVSSSGLVFIFLAILVLGVFIFLLGVNVGKKQVQMAGPATVLQKPATETVAQEPPAVLKDQSPAAAPGAGSSTAAEPKPAPERQAPADEARPSAAKEPPPVAAPRTETPRPAAVKPAPAKTAAAPGTYYIQVAAFNERSQADAFAAKFKGQGYPAVVLEPFPTDRRATFRVRLVGYKTKELASQVLAKLNAASTKRTGYYIRKEE